MRFSSRKIEYLPECFYNIKADLPSLPPPPLNPATQAPLAPGDLEPVFSRGFIEHECTLERHVPIPPVVRDIYATFRPTPLIRATRLERHLMTPARIFYKYEGANPTGSHKINTALMQAYLAAQEGITTLTTETGAGQWGSALASTTPHFKIRVKVFMVRASYRQKPGRRIMMELFGTDVVESPSATTRAGRCYYDKDPDHPGSLGIAISEAIETALQEPGAKYSLGSVLDGVLMHQTVIGLEAEKQMAEFDAVPDVIIGCVGGGSNFAGIAFPYVRKVLAGGRRTRFIAVEPSSCPTMTEGERRYDHGDSVGMTPLLYMHTLGRDFIPPPIHAGGLRYHGVAPLVSHLVHMGLVEPRAYPQEAVFESAAAFFRTEGILPAPESSHAIAAVFEEANRAREENQPETILFNLSGHGFLDISAYERNGRHSS